MQVIVYTLYGLILTAFLIFAGFAVNHAFRYSYISPRVKAITWIFVAVSLVLISVSVYFLTKLNL